MMITARYRVSESLQTIVAPPATGVRRFPGRYIGKTPDGM
jgi:hypothetical protein